ncbi:MAG: dTDP-4-dehydrorhamnose 3,5-epimerase [Deltaproteobacteria bacterium]|jgi:dTDP-4-dehydrorhamnose 3,5-epimerase|nr:dTDP-4-dehydrorhamnose 3,5-epimerase [Deltaproteobacteria bacterium]
MQIRETGLPGLRILNPKVHKDHRGFFLESFREEFFQNLAEPVHFVQDNHARSEEAGVLRGLHYQAPPAAQTKLIWVGRGAAFDVVVDLRRSSPTYGKSYGLVLTSDNFLRVLIPKGFAHGYMTLEPGTEFHYKVDHYYSPENEGGLRWNDPALQIDWPDRTPIMTERDNNWPLLADLPAIFG